MQFNGISKEYLHLQTISKKDCSALHTKKDGALSILWFQSNNNEIGIDGKPYLFHKNDIVFLTEFHKINVECLDKTRFIRFNRSFYCILEHDNEVSCKGILFFGASTLPYINIPKEEIETFETLWRMFEIEMTSKDALQREMLQMMLKRYLILSTRIFKNQNSFPEEIPKINLIRNFNFLVEKHFRTRHTVSQYAELLHKSPKTLSNLFSKYGCKTPLQFIHERKLLEARRLLRYTDKAIKEIAYEIGYEDIQSFSRFFKTHEGISPTEYKDNSQMGIIANS